MSWQSYKIETPPKVQTENRKIATQLPCEQSVPYLEKLNRFESRSMHGQFPLLWDKAIDFNIYDMAGNKWIDFTSTAFVTNTGHANPGLSESLKECIDSRLLHSYAFAHKKRADYCESLVEFSSPFFEKCYLVSSGTEATDTALKLMRIRAKEKGKGAYIIGLKGNWHGRTMGAQFLCHDPDQKSWIGHEDPHVLHLNFPYKWEANDHLKQLEEDLLELERLGIDISKDVAGFFLETFQGWCANFYPKEFVKKIETICKDHDIALGFDEIQAGFARTGEKFGFIHYDVRPDLICIGKGMGGGAPLSGVLGTKEIMDLPDAGDMSSTHSANPLSCSAGLAVLDQIKGLDLVNESARKGKILLERLTEFKQKYPCVMDFDGNGLLAAIIIQKDGELCAKTASDIVKECYLKGVLFVHTKRPSIKIAPPLTISDEALLEGLEVLEKELEKHA